MVNQKADTRKEQPVPLLLDGYPTTADLSRSSSRSQLAPEPMVRMSTHHNVALRTNSQLVCLFIDIFAKVPLDDQSKMCEDRCFATAP